MLTLLKMIEVYVPALHFKDWCIKKNPSLKLFKSVAVILPVIFPIFALIFLVPFILRLIEPLNYFETHYWQFRQTYYFENN